MRLLALFFFLAPVMASAAGGVMELEFTPMTSALVSKRMPNGYTSSDGAVSISCSAEDHCVVRLEDSKLTAKGNSSQLGMYTYDVFLTANADARNLFNSINVETENGYYGVIKYFGDAFSPVRLSCTRKGQGYGDDFSCTFTVKLG